MSSRRIILSLALLSLVLAGCGAAAPAQQRSLAVTGTGKVEVAPDIVTVNLGVQTTGEDIAQVVADNNRRAERVKQAVIALGVAEDDVRTISFYVSPQPQYDENGNPTGVTIYWVDNTVTVTLRQIDQLGRLLQAAVDAGANSIQGVSFSVDDPSSAEDQARQLAMEDARARAEMLAQAAGAALGDPISISTSVSVPAPYVAGIGGGGGVPVSPGMAEVQVQVYVTYELEK
ncbi:MAG: SIMPL domain-containing protein [Chloroflexota bacterium]